MHSRLFHAVIATGIALGAVACSSDDRPHADNGSAASTGDGGARDAALDAHASADASPLDGGVADAAKDSGPMKMDGGDAGHPRVTESGWPVTK
jgi:hypothetical protein